MQGGFLLNVVVTQGTTIFQLLSGKDETLLIRGDTFLVLNLGLDVVNGIRGFDIQSDGLSCKSFDKDLMFFHHDENKSRTLVRLPVVILQLNSDLSPTIWRSMD